MLLVAATFSIAPDRAEAFRDRVVQQARDSLAEPGCRRFDCWCNTNDCTRVFLFQVYDDRAAFNAHLASEYCRDFEAGTREWVQEKSIEIWTLAPAR